MRALWSSQQALGSHNGPQWPILLCPPWPLLGALFHTSHGGDTTVIRHLFSRAERMWVQQSSRKMQESSSVFFSCLRFICHTFLWITLWKGIQRAWTLKWRFLHSSFQQQQMPRNVSRRDPVWFLCLKLHPRAIFLHLLYFFVLLWQLNSLWSPNSPQYPNAMVMTLEMSALTFCWFGLLAGSSGLCQVLKSFFYLCNTYSSTNISTREWALVTLPSIHRLSVSMLKSGKRNPSSENCVY